MSNASDFIIENGVLIKYTGSGGEVVIPDSVTSIGKEAFLYCYSLTGVVIPDGVTSIGGRAFAGCESLKSVVIPDGVTSISEQAFSHCNKLTKVVIPNNVTSIGNSAFSNCYSLTGVVIPDGVTSIGDYAFYHCSKLASVVIPNGVTSIGDYVFAECRGLTSVVIPDGVTSIGDYVFAECRGLTSVVIPDGVTSIGNSAFLYCENLTSVVFQSMDVAFTAASFSNCDKLTEIVVPEGFLATSQRRPPMLIPFIKRFSKKEAAYIWLFQDDKWLAAIQQTREDVNQIAQYILETIPQVEKLTPKMQTRLTEFVDWAYPEITSENVQGLCDAVSAKDAKVAKKFLTAEAVQRGLSSKRAIETLEPIEEFAVSLLENRPLHPNATVFTKGIPYAGKEKLCSPRLLNILVSEYLYLYDIYQKSVFGEMTAHIQLDVPMDAVIPTGADQIAAALDRNALSNSLENMVYSCNKAYRPWMYAYARFATEESAKKLLHHPPSGSSSKVRYWRENLDEAMLFSETKAAIEQMEKKGLMAKYTHIRGMSVQEFRDQYFLPKWDMNEAGVIQSAYGRLGFALTDNFTLRPVELATGKELRSVSAKTDPDAANEYKELKKEVADFYKKRAEYIRNIYITAEHMDVQSWRNTYCSNPILCPVTQKIIWMDAAGESFMLTEGQIRNVRGEQYEPKDWVVIAHVLDMSAEQIDAWQNYLAKTGKKLLIEQVWEPVAAISDVEMYDGVILSKEDRNEFKRVLGRKAIAVKSENDYSEFDHRANRYVFSDTGTMHVGQSLKIDYRINEETGETTLCNLWCMAKTLTRELNTILFELGRVSVKDVIRKDAAELLSQLLAEHFTAAQIAEFIRLAQESGSTATTAILLDYKQKNCPILDPLAEFTLD